MNLVRVDSELAASAVDSSTLPLRGGTPGKTVVATERGPWRLIANSNLVTPDGCSYVAGTGGLLWERIMGPGAPGATLVSSWLVSPSGTPADTGLTSGHGIPWAELMYRLGHQQIDGAVVGTVTINAPSDDATPKCIRFHCINGPRIFVLGAKTDTTADLTVAASTQWSTSTTEGQITVTGRTWTAGDFYRVNGGARNGAWFVVDKDLGSGAVRRAGGIDFNTFDIAKPLLNDKIRQYSITRWSSASSAQFEPTILFDVVGNGQLWVEDIDIGPVGSLHEVAVNSTGNGLYFFGCRLRGIDIYSGGEGVAVQGCDVIDSHCYGHIIAALGTRWSANATVLNARRGGFAHLNAANLFRGQAPTAGGSEGPGTIVIDGPVAFCDYTSGVVLNHQGSSIEVDSGGKIWGRDAVSSALAMIVNPGTAVNCQTTTQLPTTVGTANASPYRIGGAAKTEANVAAVTSSAALTNNGAGVFVKG